MKILLVEDEKAVAGFIKKGFESEGFVLDIAYDGQTGQLSFLKNSYDVIILDVNINVSNKISVRNCVGLAFSHLNIPDFVLS